MNKPSISDKGSRPLLQRSESIFATLGAVLLGFVVLMIGGAVSGALMFANLKLAPTLPLFLPATVLWLWLFWRYVRGDGWPRSTSDRRRDMLRVRKLSLACVGMGAGRRWACPRGGHGNRLHDLSVRRAAGCGLPGAV